MPYLLDTNVLSELRKGRNADASVRRWATQVGSDRHFISVLSLGEIRKGIEVLRRRAPKQCAPLEDWLGTLRLHYSEDILPVSEQVCHTWGCLMAERTFPAVDGLLAATAQTHHLTIATRNTSDFEGAGVRVVNPFLKA